MSSTLDATAPEAPAMRAVWCALIFIPLVTWVKDAAVVATTMGAILMLLHTETRTALSARVIVRPWMIAGVAFMAWSVIAIAWSPAPGVVDWIKAAAAIVISAVVACGIARMPQSVVARLIGPAIGAVLALLGLLLVERLTHGFFIGLYRTHDAWDRLFDIMSPGLALLSCLAFPAAALIRARTETVSLPVLFLLACLLLGISYRMDAAPFGLACGAISFAFVWFAGRRGFMLVIAGIAALALAWGYAAAFAWDHSAHLWFTHEVNYNWGYRVEIWNRVHGLIGEQPWIGHGFDAARVLGHVTRPDVMFLHPHNGMLQVWLELGLVGVVLFLACVAASTRQFLASAPTRGVCATTAATLTVVSVFWLVSFGIWQGWWISAIGITFCALVLTVRATRINPPSDG